MTTFAVPSLLRAAGRGPAHALGHNRDDGPFGDGAIIQLLLDHVDPIFAAVSLAGYRPMAWWVQVFDFTDGDDGETSFMSSVTADHLGFRMGWVDWLQDTGFAAPDPQDLVVALAVEERTRYLGAGPRFGTALAGLGRVGPITDDANDAQVTIDVQLDPEDRLVGLQITVRQTTSPAIYQRQLGALAGAGPTIAAVFLTDLLTAAEGWWEAPALAAQPGVMPIFNAGRWSHANPWDDDADRQLIDQIGGELFTAMRDGTIDTAVLLESELLQTRSVGELLALARGLPDPPQAADDLVAAMKRRLASVSGWAHHPEGGPLEGAEQLTYGRLLMLAHNLRVIDVLGSSTAADDPADVGAVDPLVVQADITGFYETLIDYDENTDLPHRTTQPQRVGCLQVNQVGRAATGWWQARANVVDDDGQPTGHWRATQMQFVASLVTDGATSSVWEFQLQGEILPPTAVSTGTMTFDHSSDPPALTVHVEGNDDPANNPVELPDGLPTVWDYIRLSASPHLAERAFESLPPAAAGPLRALHRTPLNGWERYWIGQALVGLDDDLEDWAALPQGATKLGHALDTDEALEEDISRYLHLDHSEGLILAVRQFAREFLLGRSVKVNGRRHSTYVMAVNMVVTSPGRTPVLAGLLGIDASQADENLPVFTYDWHVDLAGLSGDVAGGGGVLTGTITIDRSPDDTDSWPVELDCGLVEYGYGLSAGFLTGKHTGGTIRANADWSPQNFQGGFDVWGVESGAFIARWGYTGGITFYGDGANPPLHGDANGLNVAAGLYVAIIEFGGAFGSIVDAGGELDLQAIIRPEFTPAHVTAGEWMGVKAYFDTDSSVVRAEMVPQLEGMLAEHLAAFTSPHGRLQIDGHASAPAPDAYNEALSQRRAQAVCEAMRMLVGDRFAIPEEEIEIIAHGESAAPGGPDGPDVQSARKVEVFMDADIMISY